jgi:hypothetical protein
LQNRVLPDIRGQRFEAISERAAWSAAIAQLVEHVIRNDGVTGSSPVCGTNDLAAFQYLQKCAEDGPEPD